MMTSTMHPSVNPRLEVVALSDHEWRVSDRLLDKADPRRVVGYIELLGEGYEVLALLPAPTPCGRFSSWNAALSAVAALALGGGGRRTPGFAGGAAG